MKTECPCGRTVHYKALGLCRKCYLSQWKRSPRGKAVVAANRLKHATRLNAARKAKRAADGDRSHSKRQIEYHRRLRAEVIAKLGGRCACCGESEMMFLELDHIHGGGLKHYKLVGSWTAVYRAVRDAGFPKDQYRILCANCNRATSRYNTCPHERSRLVEALLAA